MPYKKYYQRDPEKYKNATKEWQEKNPDYKKSWEKEDYKKDPEKYLERSRQWRKDSPEKYRECQGKCERNRYKTSPKHNLIHKVKSAIRSSLRGNKAGRHWEDLVGYTLDDLMGRLKSTVPEGYNWQDYLKGRLHIDHIIPMRAFIFKTSEDEEFKQCWSLYNLRLLPSKENLLKKDLIDNPILLGLLVKNTA